MSAAIPAKKKAKQALIKKAGASFCVYYITQPDDAAVVIVADDFQPARVKSLSKAKVLERSATLLHTAP